MNEQELMQAIAQAEKDRQKNKKKISRLQKQVVDAESNLIEATLKKDRLVEELRRFRKSDPTYTPDARDIEIEKFRERFPEYSKRIDAENEALKLKK